MGSTIFRFKVEAETGSIVNRIEVLLLEKVGKPRESLFVERWLPVLGAAKSIDDEESVGAKGVPTRLEVA
jgi:hypothetical protein